MADWYPVILIGSLLPAILSNCLSGSRLAVTHPKSLQYACKVRLTCQGNSELCLDPPCQTFTQLFLFQSSSVSFEAISKSSTVYSGNYKTFLNMFVIDARLSIILDISRIFEEFLIVLFQQRAACFNPYRLFCNLQTI